MSDVEVVVLHVPVVGAVSLRRTPASLEAFQALVGGDVECVPINEFAEAYVDEEGRLKVGARPNQVLNGLSRMLGAPVPVAHHVGDAVVFGGVDAYGRELDVDPAVVSVLTLMGVPVSNLDLDIKYSAC